MKLVVVAMPNSVHVARWLASVADEGWTVHLFPSNSVGHSHPQLRGATVHHFFRALRRDGAIRERGLQVFDKKVAHLAERLVAKALPDLRRDALVRLIERVRPDVVHSMEFQHAGYVTLAAREAIGDSFPPWLVTNWGNDIYHFAQFPEHAAKIRRILALADAYTCECERDVRLARQFGFEGTAFPPFPNAGGFDLERIWSLRSGPPSKRRVVMVKGYQHYVGRALSALRAVELCAREMRGFRLCVYSATGGAAEEAKAMAARSGIDLEVIPYVRQVPHDEMLRRHGEARASVGLSLSDGVSTSFIEALVMGSFPIQSWTACADEWIVDSETGALVPPDDSEATAAVLRRALTDDALVDAAAERNWETASRRLDARVLSRKALEIYRALAPR